MLNVEERFMMKEMQRKGMSVSQIARETGRDRKTVRKALIAELGAKSKTRRPRKQKLTAYEPYLEQRLAEGVYNAHKLFGELQQRGYRGGETRVRDYVRERRPVRPAAATVRFETAPGEQGQVDWGCFGYIEHQQRQRRLYGFVLTLGWSRAMYVEFTVAATMPWFLRCHQHAFSYLGGVPQRIVHDNLKSAVVARRGGVVQWNPTYLDFAHYYGFAPHACQPYRPQTKGKVESGVKYVRNNFWLGLHYTDLYDLNQQALGWLDQVANVRIHGTTQVRPCDRLAHEPLLSHTTRPPYDTSECSYRRSSRDCLVSYDGNYYSVPAAYAGQRLLVKVDEQEVLRIFALTGEQIADHNLVHGRRQRCIVAAHYAALLPALHLSSGHSGLHQSWPAASPAAHQLPAPRVEAPRVEAPRVEAPQVEVRPLDAYQIWLEEQ